MRKIILALMAVFIVFLTNTFAQENVKQKDTLKLEFEVKVITSVESIIPDGLGRSRLISANDKRDYKEFTSTQTEDENTRNKSKRKDIRVKDFEETKLQIGRAHV